MLVGNIHVLEGGASELDALIAQLETQGMAVRGNPDAYVRSYALMGIDEARELRERALGKAREGRRLFLVATPFMTNEAQHALLKTLEEPPGDAFFFFVVASPSSLLPTLRSRMQPLALANAARGDAPDARAFLAASSASRIDMLKPLLEKGDNDERDVAALIALLAALERALATRLDVRGVREGLRAIYRARRYLADKGALIKPLLEHVALLVPQVRAER